MADTRAGGIVASSFIGGLLLTAAIFAPRAWEPVPEPFFGLEEPMQVAAPLPQQDPTPSPALSAPSPAGAVGDLSSMAAAMPAVVRPGPPPERLAMNDSAASPSLAIIPQAVPQPPPQSPPAAAPPSTPRAAEQPPVATASERATEPTPDSLKSLVTRVQMRRVTADETTQPARIEPPQESDSLGAAPLPGEAWTDPDSVNWSDATAAAAPHRQTWQMAQPRITSDQPTVGSRVLDRLRNGERISSRGRKDGETPFAARLGSGDEPPAVRRDGSQWPEPAKLIEQLRNLAGTPPESEAHRAVGQWASATLTLVAQVLATPGPREPVAATTLLALGDTVHSGMAVADGISEGTLASHARRTALAVSRRVAVWRAATGLFVEPAAATGGVQALPATHEPLLIARTEADVARLLESLERFEISLAAADAAFVKEALRSISTSPLAGGPAVVRAVTDHYLAPNVRLAIHQEFLERLLPEAEVKTSPMEETIAGRQVRGTRTVTRTTTVRFIPDPDEIAIHLEVQGDISSRSVTAAGPVSLTSRGNSSFVVQKPIRVSPQGLLFGPATGVASNRSQLDGIQTSFDSVPVMRSLVRQIAKSQHDDSLPDINREVIDKIVAKACRETDEQAEPKFAEAAERIRTKLWMPLVQLGLEPTPVALETTPTVATVRLRLAADSQLAAHTPRPRAPTNAKLSMQLHESSLNNALDRLGFAGQRLKLEDLVAQLRDRLGVEKPDRKVSDELPEGVTVTFARSQPLRIECRDGLIHVRVALDALESGRRNWYDLVAQVAYRPTASGAQVFLEREGPVQISGPGHQGRMEIALRTIFGKIFPKERPIAVLPERIVKNPRLDKMHAVQAVSSDGWFAFALASREAPATVAAPQPTSTEARRSLIFR